MSPVPYLAKPLSASYLLDVVTRGRGRWLPDFPLSLVREAPLPSGLALREISAFDADFDRLWERFAASVGFCVWRDAAYLNWRIGAKPGQRYRTLALYEQGALRGFVTFCVKDRTRGRNGYVMELMHDPGRPDFATLLLRSALARIRADRADVALAWSLPHSPNHAAFRKLGFWMVPERFHPIELHFGGRALGPTLADIGGRTDWYISYLDSDTT
jgi:hypothetical protein